MKIFDCFMYFDEDLILDLRLNYLDPFVDHFVITYLSNILSLRSKRTSSLKYMKQSKIFIIPFLIFFNFFYMIKKSMADKLIVSFEEYIKIVEKLAIEIKQIVEKNNAYFAFQSQSIYVEKK